ncbi:MAG: YitT family protein [Negativicutes bacterium]
MRNQIIRYVILSVGCIISGCSINLFFVPHHLLSGGVSGLAIIFYYLYNLPIGVQIFAMNIPLFYAAYRYLGKEFTMITIYGTCIFSFGIDATRFLASWDVIDDPIISAITGGVFAGIGGGLIFRVNGSAGGLDIIAAIIKKYYSFNVGFVGFAVNCAIMLIAATLFGLKLAVLTLIAMFITGIVIDNVLEGLNCQKTLHIVSYKSEEIIKSILKEVGRGATILHGEGAFTRQNKQIIFVVVSVTQIAQIKLLVHEADPDAFMIVQDAVEVLGRGFTLPGAKRIC